MSCDARPAWARWPRLRRRSRRRRLRARASRARAAAAAGARRPARRAPWRRRRRATGRARAACSRAHLAQLPRLDGHLRDDLAAGALDGVVQRRGRLGARLLAREQRERGVGRHLRDRRDELLLDVGLAPALDAFDDDHALRPIASVIAASACGDAGRRGARRPRAARRSRPRRACLRRARAAPRGARRSRRGRRRGPGTRASARLRARASARRGSRACLAPRSP